MYMRECMCAYVYVCIVYVRVSVSASECSSVGVYERVKKMKFHFKCLRKMTFFQFTVPPLYFHRLRGVISENIKWLRARDGKNSLKVSGTCLFISGDD